MIDDIIWKNQCEKDGSEVDVNIRSVDIDEIIKDYKPLLEEVEMLPLRVSGNSMSPFLRHGKDTIYISKITDELKKGDIVFYTRDSGQYVLHRICRVHNGTYDIIGDGQNIIEPGIRRDQIFAIVNQVERNGKILKKGNFLWDFFQKVWIRVIPLRPYLRRIYSVFKKIKCKK